MFPVRNNRRGRRMDIQELKNRDGRGYREIARAAELSPGVVWRVLNGQTRSPSMQTVAKLASALRVDVDTIIAAIRGGRG
jgi:transcriptional regulator with XRE-family HTH domain